MQSLLDFILSSEQCNLMRLRNRILVVCIITFFLLLLIQLKLLDLNNCSSFQCWPIFDYDNEQHNSTARSVKQESVKTLPSVLIIGAKKGGTRALIDSLQLHPQIIAAKREIHFFDDDSLYSKGLDWYRQQMPTAKNNQVWSYFRFQSNRVILFRLLLKRLRHI